jgi:AraC-like DNA-binding protein
MARWTMHEDSPMPSLPEVRFIGQAITPNEGWKLPPHRHDSMEISYLHRGAVRWWAGSEWTDLRGGDAYVTWPGEDHGGSLNALGGCELYWLHLAVPAGACEEFLSLPPPEARACADALHRLPRQFSVPNLSKTFKRILTRLQRPDDLALMQIRADVLAILATLCDAARVPAGGLSPLATDAIALMRRHLTATLDVSTIASQLGLSVSYVQQRFRREVGVGPAEYHLRLRIDEAKCRLRATDDPVTVIAVDLGFNSSQYFATAFKRVTGVSPSRFRGMEGVSG